MAITIGNEGTGTYKPAAVYGSSYRKPVYQPPYIPRTTGTVVRPAARAQQNTRPEMPQSGYPQKRAPLIPKPQYRGGAPRPAAGQLGGAPDSSQSRDANEWQAMNSYLRWLALRSPTALSEDERVARGEALPNTWGWSPSSVFAGDNPVALSDDERFAQEPELSKDWGWSPETIFGGGGQLMQRKTEGFMPYYGYGGGYGGGYSYPSSNWGGGGYGSSKPTYKGMNDVYWRI